MAADFVQEIHRLPDLDIDIPDISVTYSGDVSQASKHSGLSGETGLRIYNGEIVKPGVGPGVLIGETRIWRNGKEMITDVEGVFPSGAAVSMTPESSSQCLSLSSRLWCAASSATMLTFGMGAKFLLRCVNTTVIHGRENLEKVFNETNKTPVLSVINHHSCFDDPGIWGAVLSPSQLMNTRRMRWGASASEVIFANRPLETFWKLGKVIPIVRGWGVDQPAMQFLLDKLNRGGWVNIFPEGKVMVRENIERLRWGVGKLVWECERLPTIIPVLHLGMDSVLPNPKNDDESQPCVIRPGNLVTVNIGQPINLESMVKELKQKKVEAMEARRLLTEQIQNAMERLYQETKLLHRENIVKWLQRWHDRVDTTPSILT